jgi:hypothetical protein
MDSVDIDIMTCYLFFNDRRTYSERFNSLQSENFETWYEVVSEIQNALLNKGYSVKQPTLLEEVIIIH